MFTETRLGQWATRLIGKSALVRRSPLDGPRPDRPSGTLSLWLYRLRLRHELARLSSTQMRDTGLNPEWVAREAAKPFWRE